MDLHIQITKLRTHSLIDGDDDHELIMMTIKVGWRIKSINITVAIHIIMKTVMMILIFKSTTKMISVKISITIAITILYFIDPGRDHYRRCNHHDHSHIHLNDNNSLPSHPACIMQQPGCLWIILARQRTVHDYNKPSQSTYEVYLKRLPKLHQ